MKEWHQAVLGSFSLDVRKNYSIRVVGNRLHREAVESPSLKVLKKCGEVVLKDMV